MLRVLFFLPRAPRRRGGTGCGSRTGRTRASPQRSAGWEKPSSASAAAARLLLLQVALEAPAERRFPRDGPSGRPGRAASLRRGSLRAPAPSMPAAASSRRYLPARAIPLLRALLLLSPSCIWMSACACRPGLDEAERRRRSQTGGRLRGGACAACACVCV